MGNDRQFEALRLEIKFEESCDRIKPAFQAQDSPADLEQLKLLFDYTKFHIGLYTTIAAIFGALAAADKAPFKFNWTLLFCAIIYLCLAGFAGGVIASSIPQFQSYRKFWETPIGPMRWKALKAEYWTYLEHGYFWSAITLAVLSIIID
jgi:hypothetical protein